MEGIHLQKNTSLQNGRYKILSILGEGGFGITYLAALMHTGVYKNIEGGKVAIKELFISNNCNRDNDKNTVRLKSDNYSDNFFRIKQKFLNEANTLAKFSHPNIVQVIDIFEENNTAYLVMEYVEGEHLEKIVVKKGKLTEKEALKYITQVASALKQIHSKSILHLDIKPENILITPQDNAILIDFGIARQIEGGDNSAINAKATIIAYSNGYAPNELYSAEGKKNASPCSDIYSLAATLYFCLTCVQPLDAPARINNDMPEPKTLEPHISQNVNDAIMKAMKLLMFYRYQIVDDFLKDLNSLQSTNQSINQNNNQISENNDTLNSNIINNSKDDTETEISNNQNNNYNNNKPQNETSKSNEVKTEIRSTNETSKNKKPIMIIAVISIILISIIIGYFLLNKNSENYFKDAIIAEKYLCKTNESKLLKMKVISDSNNKFDLTITLIQDDDTLFHNQKAVIDTLDRIFKIIPNNTNSKKTEQLIESFGDGKISLYQNNLIINFENINFNFK